MRLALAAILTFASIAAHAQIITGDDRGRPCPPGTTWQCPEGRFCGCYPAK